MERKKIIVMTTDRDGDPVFAVHEKTAAATSDEYEWDVDAMDCLAFTKCEQIDGDDSYLVESQQSCYAPITTEFTGNQFRQLVNQLVKWLLEVDPDYLAP